ncbi:MAG: hypothetical protein E7302_16170 [Butyrivibrio sp.]|nr:hypothetical protein [Butyrivibrio sp.]
MKINEAAKIWNISERTVRNMCAEGKVPGAVKESDGWKIPDDAIKPQDGRVKSGEYIKTSSKALPIGISDYVRAESEYYYVDKTLLIKEILDKKTLVTLFTRPRRFGKTLNMDMLRVFFEKSEVDTSVYFKNRNIAKAGRRYMDHQGKYPVIFLSFKDVKFDSWQETLDKIAELLQIEFGRHRDLLSSDFLADYEKDYYRKILNKTASKVELSSSLENLSRMMFNHYKVAPIIIIDEYDTPIQEGYSKDFYDEIVDFMRNFFSGAFKDNKYLTYGFLTGIVRIAQESIFSGLNNISVNTILDDDYSDCFGFTINDVKKILSSYSLSNKIDEAKEWYDGYCFGNTEIYNPWSIINYVAKDGLPQAYWVSTGKNEILVDILRVATEDVFSKLDILLQGNAILVRVNPNIVYGSLTSEPSNIYNLLLVAGYLKIVKKTILSDGSYQCEVMIANREITSVFKMEILNHMIQIGTIQYSTADRVAESLYSKDYDMLKQVLSEYMDRSMSYYDAGAEGFYHGLTLGIVALMDNHYRIKSNRESGEGRFDLVLFPREQRYHGIIMEFKWGKNLNTNEIKAMAQDALGQIDEKRYEVEMLDAGVDGIVKIGIAFSGKRLEIAYA